MNNDKKLDAVMKIVCDEYRWAVEKHPEFPQGQVAVSIIAEELGELAKEINDAREAVSGAAGRAIIEAAHVAVTAMRTLEALAEELEMWTE